MKQQERTSKKMEKSIRAYQLKITLKHIAPPIWRRFVVPAAVELKDLHKIIQGVMGWGNGHCHQFIIHENYYGEVHEEFDNDWIDYRGIALDSLVTKEGETFEYDYDFGDGWDHRIEVEKITNAFMEHELPICLKGKRNCPPENCGGPWRYKDLVEITKNPQHKEYIETMDWLGAIDDDGEIEEDFLEPERFDLEETNEVLHSENYGCEIW